MKEWIDCKHILIIRADNIGDLIMSSPAIRAVKKEFNCKITVLTSSTAATVAELIPEVDDTIVADLPWVKKDTKIEEKELMCLVKELKARAFDAGIIFTVYSQNSWAAALLMWLAGIPLRLAYSRENPYDLINYWLPEKEPYKFIKHQVERDLELVKFIGASGENDQIVLNISKGSMLSMEKKLRREGIDPAQPFIIFHAGVSEEKRKFSLEKWMQVAKDVIHLYNIPILFTGSEAEKEMTDKLQAKTGRLSLSLAGRFNIPEFAALIKRALLLVSVNTSAVHLAAGFQTPVIVLYAQTNPQHKPWKVKSRVLEYSIPTYLHSENEVIKYVNKRIYDQDVPEPGVAEVVNAIVDFLPRY